MKYKCMMKPIEESSTGATANYHKIASYGIDLRNGTSSVIVQGWVSEEMHLAQRQFLVQSSLNIQAVPPSGIDVDTWLYEMIAAPAEPITGDPSMPMQSLPMQPIANMFAGATLVPA